MRLNNKIRGLMARKTQATSKRVAELAGVSQTTVSFVLNKVDSANISEETRRRVLEAAHSIGYVPDVSARTLARGKSANIGFVIAQPHAQVFIDEYIPNIISGLSKVTGAQGYRILVELVEDNIHPNTCLNLIRGKEVAGIIAAFNAPTEQHIQELVSAAEGFPIVSLNYLDDNVPSVMVDKLNGVRSVVDHLVKLGHKRIACITYAPVPGLHDVVQRLLVYRSVLESAGIIYDASLVKDGAYDPDTGYRAMQSLLELSPLPTALFAMNDVMAFGAMTAIYEAGLRIPEDIAVVGFDDIRLAAFSTPALTTVREPNIEHGCIAGTMLIDLINNKPIEHHHIVLKTELKIRDSCGFKLQRLQ
jgi:DNA-binding LacI/PurR family transcriptional regulator